MQVFASELQKFVVLQKQDMSVAFVDLGFKQLIC
jgi:hypothetical protein